MVQEEVPDGLPGAVGDLGAGGRAVAGAEGRAPASSATARATASASRGWTSSPVRRWATRSSGPPTAGATTGTPLAMASWMVWQKVSIGPVWTKTSREA